ncbi:spore coat protein, CotS family [Marininema mesophilum]|uniref:Spore coat protein, CotS family n=1 Tax=Marininema mesophilum TaxID=1048340 RepID=A0A1H3CFR5_9BACL|nr:phosphotransferase [Marininema mesophilum]SDX52434.1 spore coat protein, CotS family [Marininema mesophilum]
MADVKKLSEWTGEPRLPEVLQHHYGLRLKEVTPVGGVLQLNTDRGDYALKRVREREEPRWVLVRKLAQHLSETGEQRIQAPVKTKRGTFTFAGLRNRYVLLPWIDAKVKEWHRDSRLPRVALSLARFHTDSRGFTPPHTATTLVHAGKWKRIWGEMEKSLNMLKMAADMSEKITPVDQVWVRHCSFAEGMMENAQKYLDKMGGDEAVKESRKGGEVCHCNIHRQNVLWDKQDHVHLIDWNCVTMDVRSRDLARLCLYAYGHTGDLNAPMAILKGYQEVAPLEEEEYGLIYSQLLFPHRLIQSLHKIYREQRVPSDQAKGHLSATVDLEERKQALLRDFPERIKAIFGVKIPQVDWLKEKHL